ncbi:hypothetical protein NJ7G_0537 [Natrinema sp. J7-2]|nr:hypothetical protein NJ7G_0537 [Natrinema sp. J7-2]
MLMTRGLGFCGQKPMSMKTVAGLQDSGTATESSAKQGGYNAWAFDDDFARVTCSSRAVVSGERG